MAQQQRQPWQSPLQLPLQFQRQHDPALMRWPNFNSGTRNTNEDAFSTQAARESTTKVSLLNQSGSNLRKRRCDEDAETRASSRVTKHPVKKLRAQYVSKYKGVTWHKRDQKWMARVWIPKLGRVRYLGTFFSEDEAAEAITNTNEQLKGGADFTEREARGSRSKPNKEEPKSAAEKNSSSSSSFSAKCPSTEESKQPYSFANEQDAALSDRSNATLEYD
jgi:hypothetical protein